MKGRTISISKTMEDKKTIIWIVVGVVAGLIVIYFAATSSYISNKPSGVETPQGTVVVPGTNAINDSGEVVTKEGKPVQQDATPGTPEAPQQSAAISVEEIPPSAVKLEVSSAGFKPSQFTVKAGAAVTISLTTTDQTHLFYFDDPSLQAVAIGIGPGETRAITFNAPAEKGTYGFHCDVPGHTARGEVGQMIVE
jgi:uncharacterized cupredoxin-like copper-binding protein